MTLTRVDVSQRTVLSVTIENANDHSIACNHIASMVVDGIQIDKGFPNMSEVASNVSLDSKYSWKKSIAPSFSSIRLIVTCRDEEWGGGRNLQFDVPAEPR